jgi:tetratricopeptide (TPR) repeat protein
MRAKGNDFTNDAMNEATTLESLLARQRFAEAAALASRMLVRSPRQLSAHVGLVRALLPSGRLGAVEAAVDRALRVAPNDPQLQHLKAVVDHRLGRSAAAVDRLRALRAKRPPNEVEVVLALAEVLHRAARREELDALIAEGGAWVDDERAAFLQARTLLKSDRERALAELERVSSDARSPVLKRIAGFEAVRVLDADGRYREAYELAESIHAATTPQHDLGGLEADVAEQLRFIERVRGTFAPKAAAVDRTALVIGLPRSGTTLLEQMLDRHPEITGIGEYEGLFTVHERLVGLGAWPSGLRSLARDDAAPLAAEYLEGARARCPGGAGWTFDKTLIGWRTMPALAAVLPGAALVRITRDPRDTAISMFLSNFHPQSYGFTASLDQIRRVIALERRVVPQAVEALGLRTVSVVYEELVDAPEREIRRVLDLLGLPFDPCVLAPESNARTVLTLSHEQVRRPINRSSIGRWKNYAFAFGPDWDALA